MSEIEIREMLVRLERARLVSLVVAFVFVALAVVFDSKIFLGLRVASWCVGGGVCIWEGVLVKKLDEDPTSHYLRGAMFFAVALASVALLVAD